MQFKAEILYGAYWSTPFVRWQGSLANLHSVEFDAHVARTELARRNIDAPCLTMACLVYRRPRSTPSTGFHD